MYLCVIDQAHWHVSNTVLPRCTVKNTSLSHARLAYFLFEGYFDSGCVLMYSAFKSGPHRVVFDQPSGSY